MLEDVRVSARKRCIKVQPNQLNICKFFIFDKIFAYVQLIFIFLMNFFNVKIFRQFNYFVAHIFYILKLIILNVKNIYLIYI